MPVDIASFSKKNFLYSSSVFYSIVIKVIHCISIHKHRIFPFFVKTSTTFQWTHKHIITHKGPCSQLAEVTAVVNSTIIFYFYGLRFTVFVNTQCYVSSEICVYNDKCESTLCIMNNSIRKIWSRLSLHWNECNDEQISFGSVGSPNIFICYKCTGRKRNPLLTWKKVMLCYWEVTNLEVSGH